jgi:hypothetical protein
MQDNIYLVCASTTFLINSQKIQYCVYVLFILDLTTQRFLISIRGHSRVTGGTFLLIVYNFAAKFYVFFVEISKVLIPKQKCTHSFIFIT